MSRDWKDTLKTVQMAKTGRIQPADKPLYRKKKEAQRGLRKVIGNYLKTHPRDMLIKLSPHFNTILYSNTGNWPDNSSLEVSSLFALENVGDLIKVIIEKPDCVLMRTNRGYFKFINQSL